MRAWTELKRLLNKEKYISRNKLIKGIEKDCKLYHGTISDYIFILTYIGYIKTIRENLSKYDSISVPYCKLIKKIPEKLTIADAKKMKRMPWLQWFKYPE